MKFNGFGDFEEFAKFCGFSTNEDSSTEGCYDIPNGFQQLDPMLVTVIGELVGNVIAGNLPFNIQNLVGNWLMLVGQAIETFNAQQQYFQNGPGRYFNVKNFNITNPYCPENSEGTSSGGSTVKSDGEKNNKKAGNDINELKNTVKDLQNQINSLQNIIKKLEK